MNKLFNGYPEEPICIFEKVPSCFELSILEDEQPLLQDSLSKKKTEDRSSVSIASNQKLAGKIHQEIIAAVLAIV